jgi:hypothetical protein
MYTAPRKVLLKHCSETTAAGMRAWMRVMDDLTTVRWQEADASDPQSVDIVICDPPRVADANVDAYQHDAVLAVWGRHYDSLSTLAYLTTPITPKCFLEFIVQVESHIAKRRWGLWWRRSHDIASLRNAAGAAGE